MFNLTLAIIFTISSFLNTSAFIQDFNAKIDQYYENPKQDNTAGNNVIWINDTSPLSEKLSQKLFLTDAKAAYAADLTNGEELEKKNENSRLPVASLTKLMTAYVILRYQPLEKEMTVPKLSSRADDSLMGISVNESLKVQDLLRGLLINSGGDAAQTLAINDSGSIPGFVAKMNNAAKELSLANTHFENPVGWDSAGNYSSAKDISTLARILLDNKFFAQTVSKKSLIVSTKAGRKIQLVNTNLLLNNTDIIGVKTGFTSQAGECLVTLRSVGKHKILTVIIGSADRFGQTRVFLDWIHRTVLW